MTSKKKMVLAGALALVMAGSAIAGTLAYLTDSASLDNTFLVGAFTPPTDPKPDPDPPGPGPDYPPKPSDDDMGKPTTYIYEPYWNANGKDTYNKADGSGTEPGDKHRLLAGDTTVKDPYIGIGKDSESGYVLACITNPMAPYVYFTLCDGWAPVTGMATEVTITADNGSAETGKTYYSKGLFKWVGTGNSASSDPLVAIEPGTKVVDGKTEKTDAWTDNPVFTYVYTDKSNLKTVQQMPKANQKMTVWAYIGQSNGTQDDGSTPIDAAYVETQAKAWAQKTDAGYPGYSNT